MRIRYLLLTSILFLPSIAKSTCILVWIIQDKIYVGADSRRTYYGLDTLRGKVKEQGKQDICKIYHVGKFYFVVSGHGDLQAADLAKQSCVEGKSIQDVVSIFAEKINIEFPKLLEPERRLFPEKFKEYIPDSGIVGSLGGVAFFGFEKGVPKLVTVFYDVASALKDPVKLSFFFNYNTMVSLGMVREINSIPPSDTSLIKFARKGALYLIEALIKRAEKYHPEDIGGPIDLLTVSSKGEIWLKRKKLCIPSK